MAGSVNAATDSVVFSLCLFCSNKDLPDDSRGLACESGIRCQAAIKHCVLGGFTMWIAGPLQTCGVRKLSDPPAMTGWWIVEIIEIQGSKVSLLNSDQLGAGFPACWFVSWSFAIATSSGRFNQEMHSVWPLMWMTLGRDFSVLFANAECFVGSSGERCR